MNKTKEYLEEAINLVNQKLNFRETKIKKRYPSKKISIIYAGNIGFGQGLENTILKLSDI